MEDFFKIALKFVLAQEGGYSNDPDDNGGATNFGITQGTYNNYRQKSGLKAENVKKITLKEAEDIYYQNYWLACGCQNMSKVFALLCFDTAVNMGVSTAKTFLKKALWKYPEIFLLSRIEKYAKIAKNPSQRKFLLGWLNRTFRLYAAIKEL